jgi:hypothetical protein
VEEVLTSARLRDWYNKARPFRGQKILPAGTRLYRALGIFPDRPYSETQLQGEPFYWTTDEAMARQYVVNFGAGGHGVQPRHLLVQADVARDIILADAPTMGLVTFLYNHQTELQIPKMRVTDIQRLYATPIFRQMESIQFNGVWQNEHDILIEKAGETLTRPITRHID